MSVERRSWLIAEVTVTPAKQTNGAIHRWDPVDLFDALQQQMERFWRRALPSFSTGPLPAFLPGAGTGTAGLAYAPRLDVYEKDNTLVVKAELPGMKKEDVHVELDGRDLVIKGERKLETAVKEDAYYHMERSFGVFYRRIPLPFDATTQDITATLTGGVLEIKIPRPSTRRTRSSSSPADIAA